MRRIIVSIVIAGAALWAMSAALAQTNDSCNPTVYDANQCRYLPLISRPEPTQTATPTPVPVVNTIINGGFEQGPGVGWETFGGAFIANEPSLARSGSWFGFMGGQNDSAEGIAQRVVVPPGAPYLTYWYRALSEDFLCSADLGGVFVDPAPYDSEPSEELVMFHNEFCESRSFVEYRPVSIDLSGYAGREVDIIFFFTTDATLLSFWSIDDVAFAPAPIVASPQAPATTGRAELRERLEALRIEAAAPAPATTGRAELRERLEALRSQQ